MAAGLNDVTVLVAIDAEHFNEFKWCYPTWMRYRPEMQDMDMVIVCDTLDMSSESWHRLLEPILKRDFRVVPWDNEDMYEPDATQRERMLTGLVAAPSYEVHTDWYMKIDTDAYCDRYDKGWFNPDWLDKKYSYVAPRWGYTKPAKMLLDCELWSSSLKYMKNEPPVVPPDKYPDNIAKSGVGHRRMISWVGYGNVEFTRLAWGTVVNSGVRRMPCPSQDTFLYFMAVKLGWPISRVNMKKYGWKHSFRGAKKHVLSDWDGFASYCSLEA